MTLQFSALLLVLLGLSLIFITLSVWLGRAKAPQGDASSPAARFFLVGLRIAIGWHCFVEGMEKIGTPTWSSESYLRESSGPLAGAFRSMAGDRLIEKLTVGADGSFPAELERDWRNFFNAFAAHYELSNEQLEKAEGIYKERQKDVLAAFAKPELVSKVSAYPPDLKVEMTMAQRLEEHERLAKRVREAEEKFPSTDKDIHRYWKDAKADLAKWRAELTKAVNAEMAKLRRVDEDAREKLKKKIDTDTKKLKETKNAAAADKLKKSIDADQAKVKLALFDVLTHEQKYSAPMPEPSPAKSWRLLDISDFLVKWSLTVFGALLMLGLLSRAMSLATACLLFSFYIAMPPLPGWPESPRLEGHYLIVNKTLIEVIALLALTFLPTGRWAGLDGLLCLFCCRGAKMAPDAPTKETPKETPTNTNPQQGTLISANPH
jgi:uncharacterized membrane protein YphA (DoxX/SURF4 family)